MRIAIGADHGGFALKEVLVTYLTDEGHTVIDRGTHSTDAVDYPDYAVKVGESIQNGEAELGIMIDGAGIGSSMALNKMEGILAAVCNEFYVTRNSRLHNSANVMTLGSMVVGPGLAKELVSTFINTPYEGGRHDKRVSKIHAAAGTVGLTFAGIKRIVEETVRKLSGNSGVLSAGLATIKPESSRPITSGTAAKHGAKRLISEHDVRQAHKNGSPLRIDGNCIVTPLARDAARDLGVKLEMGNN